MCNENRNILIDIDFSQVNDVNNWVTNASNIIDVNDGRLVLIADNDNTVFDRLIGQLNSDRDSLKIDVNFILSRQIGSNELGIEIAFDLLVGNQVVQTAKACVESLSSNQSVSFNLDRTYELSSSEDLLLRIRYENGVENRIELQSLKVEEFNFCDDNVRFYFVFDQFIEQAFSSTSGLAKLQSYKIDNQETLTNEFFQENMNSVIDQSEDWFFADANIDGQNRIKEDENPKTFNPFEKSNGLTFDTQNSFHGGKAIGTQSGSDYGQGVLNIGLLKPQILNSDLSSKNGSFFIDVDTNKNLEIVFDVLINTSSQDVFVNPDKYRRYFIKWDVVRCIGEFYYEDRLDNNNKIDEIHNGFLYGITDEETIEGENIIQCSEGINFSGNSGVFETVINFGLETGQAGIDYNAFGAPDKFTIIWNNQEFTTGFVGLNTSDQALLNLGISPLDINTGNPGTGDGILLFNKNSQQPTEAILRVDAPLSGTAWNIEGICPQVNPNTPVEVGQGDCGIQPSSFDQVFVDTQDVLSYVPSNGDVIYDDINLQMPFNGGDNTFRMRVPTTPFPLLINWAFDISPNGIVSNVTVCLQVEDDDGNGCGNNNDLICVLGQNEGTCESCWILEIKVPEGETRQVIFESNFQNNGEYGMAQLCLRSPFLVISDSTVNINQTTFFTFAIRGQLTGVGQSISEVSVRVMNAGSIEEQMTFSRNHGPTQCGPGQN